MITKEEFMGMKPKTVEERSQYKIAIHVPGSMSRGYWSPERGESRWGQNLAKMLAEAGYTVMVVNSQNQWFECLLVGGMIPMNWTQFDTQTEFDLCIDTAWNDMNATNVNYKIKAKAYVGGFWGHDHQKQGEDCLVSKKNHFYAFPIHSLYVDDETDKKALHKDKKLFWPLPILRGLPNTTNVGKREILWAIKEFWRPERHERVRNILKATKKFAEKYSEARFTFFMTQEFTHDAQDGKTPPDLEELYHEIPNKMGYNEYIPYNHVRDQLSRSRLLITNGQPPTGPITLEHIAQGGIPMLWEGPHHWKNFDNVPELKAESSEEDILEWLEIMYTDDAYYNNQWCAMKEVLWPHYEDRSIAIFDNQLDYVMGKL